MATLNTGLYDPAYEHDACGFGFVARVDGRKTRQTVDEGLQILHNMEHRGARGSDPETGDGAGILLQISDDFFRREAGKLGIELPEPGYYGVGTIFERGEESGKREQLLAEIAEEEGQKVLGFRDVPVEQRQMRNPGRRGHAELHAPVLYRAKHHLRRRFRAEAVCHPAPSPQSRRLYWEPLRREPLCLDRRLQRTLDRRPVAGVLRRPSGPGDEERPRPRSRPLFDEHAGKLGAGPSLPLRGPQRRVQYTARQC